MGPLSVFIVCAIVFIGLAIVSNPKGASRKGGGHDASAGGYGNGFSDLNGDGMPDGASVDPNRHHHSHHHTHNGYQGHHGHHHGWDGSSAGGGSSGADGGGGGYDGGGSSGADGGSGGSDGGGGGGSD